MPEQIRNISLTFKCPVDYAAMADTKGGKFCGNCQKKVYDFTNANADVFRQILAENNNNICGRFTAEQMLMQHPGVKPFWKRWLSAALVLVGINLWEGKALAQTPGHIKRTDTITPPPSLGQVIIVMPKKTDSTAIFGAVEIQPEFPGGSKNLEMFIKSHLQPTPGTKGRVIVTFVVETDGTLTGFKIIRGINTQANNEVVRVLKLSPKWHPSLQLGKPVRTQYTIPVAFK